MPVRDHWGVGGAGCAGRGCDGNCDGVCGDGSTVGGAEWSESFSGGAVFDYDQDGRMDVYRVQHGGPGSSHPNQLFHQEEDGGFKNVSAGSGLDVTGHGMGVAVGDINNDGSSINDRIYIPTASELNSMTFSGAGQAEAFEAFIQQDDYLSDNQ